MTKYHQAILESSQWCLNEARATKIQLLGKNIDIALEDQKNLKRFLWDGLKKIKHNERENLFMDVLDDSFQQKLWTAG